MAVFAINLTIEQGEDFEATFDVLNPDNSIASLPGFNAVATLRKYPGDSVFYTFSTTLTISQGKVTIGLANTVTDSLSPGRYYYDVFVINSLGNGKRYKVVEGNAIVNPSATRV
jgi:hypothetical protein